MRTKKTKDINIKQGCIGAESVQFRVSTDNMRYLEALCKYAQMLDLVTNAIDGERLSIDGVVNDIFSEILEKRLREIVRKHGFYDLDDAVQTLSDCADAAGVAAAVRNAEKAAYEREHSRILAHVPIEDRQGKLFEE